MPGALPGNGIMSDTLLLRTGWVTRSQGAPASMYLHYLVHSCLRQAPLLISPSTQWRSRRQRTGHGGSGPLSRRSFRAPRLSVQNFRIFEKREVMFRHIVGSALESAGSLLSGWLGGDHGNGDSECKRYHRGLDRARAGRAAPCCRGSRFPRRCVTSRAPGPPSPPLQRPRLWG